MKMASCAKMMRILLTMAAISALFPVILPAAGGESRPLVSVGLSATSNDPGWLFKLDAAAGYRFGRHFEVEAGLPVYFVRAPDDTLDTVTDSKAGIGNFYVDLRLMAERSGFYFSSSLRGTAPTGDEDEGFSSGRGTVDWNNYVEYDADRWTPFGSAGIASSIADTHFFTRPFTSLGLVGQFEGGLLYHPDWWISLGGSGYAVVPSGEQKIYSRIYGSGMSQSDSMNMSGSDTVQRRRRAFEEAFYTVTDAETLEDRGYSAWVDLYPHQDIFLELGYSRSVSYEYNSVFFAVRFDLGGMIAGNRGLQ